MDETDLAGLMNAFEDPPEPRSERNPEHPVMSSVLIAICGAISGADTWVDSEAYGKAKQGWLETWLDLPNGSPSHDTFGRVFRFLNPHAFQARFLGWVRQVGQVVPGEVVAMDGKQMRGAKDIPAGKAGLYMVSAWAVDHGSGLGQRKVDEKSNEITAIPEWLDVRALEGCVGTIDAMGCQTELAEKIISQHADSMLAVKGKQGTLAEDIADLLAGFEPAAGHEVNHDYYKTVNKGHARLDSRECGAVSQPDSLTYLRRFPEWTARRSLGKVVSQRQLNGKTTTKTRYFIPSLTATAQRCLAICRDHSRNLHPRQYQY